MNEIESVPGQIETKHLAFAKDVIRGLTSSPKFLLSKYFYDHRGSKLFQEIMAMPEYYLTNCEEEILRTQSLDILKALKFHPNFNVIELGAGDGSKTKHFLQTLLENDIAFHYWPIDISQKAMDELCDRFHRELPKLDIHPLVGDYFHVLDEANLYHEENLMLFLGSNIGNFEYDAAVDLLQHFGSYLSPDDKLLIGFDLQKDPKLIQKAYDDHQGITKRFNLNLLRRINETFIGDFKNDQFDYYSHYNHLSGEVRSCIFSKQNQVVRLERLDLEVSFAKDEIIRTELSKKYSFQEIDRLSKSAGFQVKDQFQDQRNYFTDSLWTKL